MGLSPVNIFKPFGLGRAKAVIAAVSGGSDSLGLLFLLKDYLSTLESPPVLIAVTVDHKLRAESALEAENVGLLCQNTVSCIVSCHGTIPNRPMGWAGGGAHGALPASGTGGAGCGRWFHRDWPYRE